MRDHGSIKHDLAHIAECQLATVEEMKGIKSTSQRRLNRQLSIAKWATDACRVHGVTYDDVASCPRLKSLLGLSR